jgi:DNA-binding winged helix-turn-helix (wHTH) protein
MAASVTAPLRFPPFALDPGRHVLRRGDADVALSPHLVDILFYLASKPGEIVTKDELLERFWPEVNVTENTLTRAIADIRKVLGDDPGAPTFIQTVARRGYRFVASTTRDRPDAADRVSVDGDPFREWVKGRLSLEALDRSRLPEAVSAFEHAVAATPDYAPAHAGLANACFLQYEITRARNAPDRAPLVRAVEHARRACAIDPALGEGWATLGYILTASGEVEEARAAARRAAALEPSSWRHHFRLGVASWGEERLRAVDRTLVLLPNFAPARFLAAMVFTARQAFGPALDAAASGAAAQSRQTPYAGGSLPASGLHWLYGLLMLRSGEIADAVRAFGREIDESRDVRIYDDEFRVNAQIAAGYAHLAIRDAGPAAEVFQHALGTMPGNTRALIGLYRALDLAGHLGDPASLRHRISESVQELVSGGRLGEAALVSCAAATLDGNRDAALERLAAFLSAAPPGQSGWQIAIDPALADLRAHPGFDRILALLAARAV